MGQIPPHPNGTPWEAKSDLAKDAIPIATISLRFAMPEYKEVSCFRCSDKERFIMAGTTARLGPATRKNPSQMPKHKHPGHHQKQVRWSHKKLVKFLEMPCHSSVIFRCCSVFYSWIGFQPLLVIQCVQMIESRTYIVYSCVAVKARAWEG